MTDKPDIAALAVRENAATDEGRALGSHLARFCEVAIAQKGKDGRCNTCAFRSGDHIANGSPETLMTALKCVLEREPFWCHEHDRPCAGWQLLKSDAGDTVSAPWPIIDGLDEPLRAQAEAKS